jgi:hypothetical protein
VHGVKIIIRLWGGEELAKNKENAKPKATRFNAEMAEEAGTRNTKSTQATTNANERSNK